MEGVKALIDQVRRFINEPRKQYYLMKSKRDWHQVCACLDVLDITTLAIESFGVNVVRENVGEKYLALYGVLQALYGQQDSIGHIYKALGTAYEPNPDLEHIRIVRHDAIGHPTERKGKKGEADSFFSVAAVWNTADRFYLARYWSDGRPSEYVEMSVQDLIEKQKDVMIAALKKVIVKMETEESEHKKKFQGESLEELFPATLNYNFEKILTAPSDRSSFNFKNAQILLDELKNVVAKFKSALERRDILPASEHLNYYFEEVEYALERLTSIFDSNSTEEFNKRDRDVYAFYVEGKLRQNFIPLAREIDEDYATKS